MVIDIEEKDLRSMVMQAMGSASMCWDSVDAAGEFEADEAVRWGEDLISKIKRHERKTADVVPLVFK